MGGPWPCYGRTLPWPWGHGQANRCSGKRGMGSTTCMLPMVGHNQRTGVRKAVHRQSKAGQGSAPAAHKCVQAVHRQHKGSAQTVCRQNTGSAYWLHEHWPMMVHGLD